MNLFQSIFFANYSGPIWAAMAIVATKIIDIWVTGRKEKANQHTHELEGVNSAHANLNKNLQGAVDAMSKALASLREEHEAAEARHTSERTRWAERVDELEQQIEHLRRLLTDHGLQPDATQGAEP